MYIYYILIGAAVLIVLSIIFLTVFVIKNVASKVNKDNVDVGDYKTEWEHIKDFSDINSEKKSKISSFKDEFDDEVNTVGADISDFIDEKKENASLSPKNQRPDVKAENVPSSDFINDYKTISFDDMDDAEYADTMSFDDMKDEDDDATRSLDEEYDYDATRSLDDVFMPKEKKIEVTLKYKDSNGLKIQKMDKEQINVGRGIGNDLLFRSDSFTSRNHAIFTIRDNELYIKDLNSKNGTFINKTTKVTGETKLEESCEITFGDVVVEVIIEK